MKKLLSKLAWIVSRPFAWFRRAVLDMCSTCYEDQEFKVMSLPRLAYFLSMWLFVVCTLAEVFGGYNAAHYEILAGIVSMSGVTYVSKKFIDRNKGISPAPEPPKGGPEDEPHD